MAKGIKDITKLADKISDEKAAAKIKGLKDIKNKLPKWAKGIIVAVAIVVIIAIMLLIKNGGAHDSNKQSSALASYGNIIQVIEGEGTIEVDRYDATSLVKGEIIACHIEEGDYVEKDQVLYEIDSGDMENSIARAENSLKSAQDNYEAVLEDISELTVTSPIKGVIKQMYVDEGDQVSPGTNIAEVIDSSVLKLKIDFLQWDAQNLYDGMAAEVIVTSTGERLSGTVKKVSTGAVVNEYGAAVSKVEILVNNPGAILPGDYATASAGGFACASSAPLEYNAGEVITAKQSGKIRDVSMGVADIVHNGAVICRIENTSLKNNLSSARMQVENAQLSLDDLQDTLENYKIKSTIAGKVIQKNSKLGDKIDNTNAQTVMAVVSDPGELSFEMTVDELDISKIKEGQAVVVTAEALEDKTFDGIVDNVSEIGTVQNGVTTYPVKIVINAEENSGLIPGMNVDAVITIDSRENVLSVPNSALQRGNIVYVKEGSPSLKDKADVSKDNPAYDMINRMQQNAPEGYVAVQVETGLGDDNRVEIVKGLQEGDEVAVYETQAAGNMFFGMGMMPGGGMSGGAMPGGGMPGGR